MTVAVVMLPGNPIVKLDPFECHFRVVIWRNRDVNEPWLCTQFPRLPSKATVIIALNNAATCTECTDTIMYNPATQQCTAAKCGTRHVSETRLCMSSAVLGQEEANASLLWQEV